MSAVRDPRRRMQDVELTEESPAGGDHRPPPGLSRRRRRVLLGWAAAIGVVLAAVLIGWQVAWVDRYPISALNREQRAGDVLPVAADGSEYVSASSRLLGEEGVAAFWVVLDTSGRFCLVVSIADIGVVRTSCGQERALERGGISLGSGGGVGGSTVSAVLLPDGGAVPPEPPGPWRRVGANVVLSGG